MIESSLQVGGASNVGCAILRQEGFSDEELVRCSRNIDPSSDSGANFYPLLRPGERFPENDPFKQPVLTPRSQDRSQYLHSILEGIARVEAAGYAALEDLGATPITEVAFLSVHYDKREEADLKYCYDRCLRRGEGRR